jgi:hypothetical protein
MLSIWVRLFSGPPDIFPGNDNDSNEVMGDMNGQRLAKLEI